MEHALPGDDLRPQRPGGMGRGALLAVIAHVGLIVALAIGVNWRASEPAGVSAELWAAVPQTAAPRVQEPPPVPQPRPEPKPAVAETPPPKPVPRDADIATEKAEREKKLREQREEREAQQAREREAAAKAAAEKKKREAEELRRRQQEEARLAQQREENLKRIQGLAGATGAPTATGAAPRDAGPSASYTGRIIARIRPNIVVVDTIPGNPMAAVEVRAAPDGTIIGRRLLKASGHAAWDEAVLRAIDRTEVLPRDVDGRVPSTIIIDFRPRD